MNKQQDLKDEGSIKFQNRLLTQTKVPNQFTEDTIKHIIVQIV